MKKARNADGTWNVYDYHCAEDGNFIGWRVVEDQWLDSIPRKKIAEIEYHACDELKIIYYGGKYRREIWYSLVHGTWGNPTKFV